MSYLWANPTGFTKEDSDLAHSVREVARNVMRPIAQELDQMSPEAVIAPGSRFWSYMRTAYELGYHKIAFPEEVGGLNLTPFQQYLVNEELGWGSFGLALTTQLCLPALAVMLFQPQNEELIKEFVLPYTECADGSLIGCWAITEPDIGSDGLTVALPSFEDTTAKPQCKARLDGNEYVITGQKAAWVSAGTIARHCLLMCNVDESKGNAGNGIFVFSLDQRGVTRGTPLSKIGARDFNQGEIFFDDVRIPRNNMLVGPEYYKAALEGWLSGSTSQVATWCVGLARAAFEEALDYAKKRRQGGNLLVEHSFIQGKLFQMYQKVESARQLVLSAFVYNRTSPRPHLEYGIAAKNYASACALEVASDAVQVFGANGITTEYLPGKLFRDARMTSICDGSSDSLSVSGGAMLAKNYPWPL